MRQILSTLLLFLLLGGCPTSLQGQNQRLPLPTNPFVRAVNVQSSESELYIAEAKVDVKITGPIAVTTLQFTVHNPNNRVLEGQFSFPLGAGQTVSRFALDIDGRMREGVVVDKRKGQEAFEEVIRQDVDPGLLEKTKGNNFRARIYPVPAQGSRQVLIAYEQELTKEGGQYRYHLPIQYGRIDQLDVQLTVFSDKKPVVQETPWGKLSFSADDNAFVASYHKKDFKKGGQLVFYVPQKNKQTRFVEKGVRTTDTYFYANVRQPVVLSEAEMPRISKLDIYWDASSSMADRDIKKEIDFLENYLQDLGPVQVNLYIFHIFSRRVGSFAINKDCTALKEALQNIAYDGATQYGSLDFSHSKVSRPDRILLFSDGINTFGQAETTLPDVPLVAVCSQLSADYAKLRYLSESTGGHLIDLMRQTRSEALAAIRREGVYFLSADYNPREIEDFYPGQCRFVATGDVFSIAGKLKARTATITLHFGLNNRVLSSQTITLSRSEAGDYDHVIERMWAQKQIELLEMRYKENAEEIDRLGQEYGIVTPNTSLLVLERLSDYIKYEITPPAELREAYDQYMASLTASDTAASHVPGEEELIEVMEGPEEEAEWLDPKLKKVFGMFKERKSWWNKTFPKKQRPTVNELSSSEEYASVVDIRYIPMVVEEEYWPEEQAVFCIDETRATNSYNVDAQKERTKAWIELHKWRPDAPYMAILEEKEPSELYAAYLSIKEEYRHTPSFYLDVSHLLQTKGCGEEALLVLSNLAEMETENYRLLRVLATRLNQLGYINYAIDYFEEVLRLRPEEPQSLRDLALAYGDMGQYQKSIDTFYRIVTGEWERRFNEIELIALEEMNHIIAKAHRRGFKPDLSQVDKRFLYEMPVDIRVVLAWDTDNSDMDLWVTDPYGELCKYSHPLTYTGGLLSRDFIGGYGPEEFLIKEAIPGKYKIEANYFGSNEQTLIGPTTIYLDIFTHYASGKEKKETITLRLTGKRDVVTIGEVVFEK